jgi:CBS domain-containing protein
MVSETGDVQTFLAQHPPFNHLSEKQLEYAGDNIYVAFSKSGNELRLNARAEGMPAAGMLIVHSGSIEVRDNQGALIDRLSSGDYLVTSVLYADRENVPRVIVLEDCLYYELSDTAFRSLVASSEELAAVCKTEPGVSPDSVDQGEEPLSRPNERRVAGAGNLTQYVREAMSKVIVSAEPNMSIHEAAALMKKHHISSLLIKSGEQLAGIITDRDFRIRVLAEGVADSKPIGSVMTRDPMCISVDSELNDAQLKMMSEGIRHLPVVDGDALVGMISQTDILRANNIEPISLIHAINRAESVEALSDVADEIPALIVKLVARDTRAIEIGKILTTLSDGVTRRLITLAENEFGEPPCDYAWLAFGSQARQELTLVSDQDNALLLPDETGKDDAAYFQDFCTFVNDGLDRCGMPYCPGEIMAKNEKWRMTLADWKKTFSGWIEEPSPKAVMHSSIFFDMRHVQGNAALAMELRDYVLERAQNNTIFLAMMCDNALLHSPPLGFFKTFVLETDGDHNNTLNLKKRGTIPIVDIARNYALSIGVNALNTIDRLYEINRAGAMSKEMSYSLIDAHEFIAGLRLETQGKQYSPGSRVDNYLDPKELSPLVRHQLKDAFNVVRDAQTAMKARFGGGVL